MVSCSFMGTSAIGAPKRGGNKPGRLSDDADNACKRKRKSTGVQDDKAAPNAEKHAQDGRFRAKNGEN